MDAKKSQDSSLFRLILVGAFVTVPFVAVVILTLTVRCVPVSFVPAVATMLAVFVALFREQLAAWIWQPTLEVSYVHGPDYCDTPLLYCVVGQQTVPVECYYFSLRISNIGSKNADTVEVFAKDIYRQTTNGWSLIRRFALDLKWAWLGCARLPTLAPNMDRFCNIGHVIYPSLRVHFANENLVGNNSLKTLFSLDLESQANHGIHLLEPGTYKLTLQVVAANYKPIQRSLVITLSGNWVATSVQGGMQQVIDIRLE